MNIKSALLSFAIGGLIGIPLAVCAHGQQVRWERKPGPEPFVIRAAEEEAEISETPAVDIQASRKSRPEEPLVYFYTEEEKALLMALSQAEAGNQGVEGMALVMNVVNNRIRDEGFPSTVEGVIFQDGQFQPADKLSGIDAGEEAWEALWLMQHGWDESDGALYFEAEWVEGSFQQRCCEFLFQKGGHKFYR